MIAEREKEVLEDQSAEFSQSLIISWVIIPKR